MKSNRSTKAFTLVELLVVIGIIAILISLLLPSLNRARLQARALAGLSNLKQIGVALNFYVNDHQGYLPVGYYIDSAAPPGVNTAVCWATLIKQYLGKDKDEHNLYTNVPKIFQDPSAFFPGQGRIHYSCNPALMPYVKYNRNSLEFDSSLKLTQVHPVTDIITIFDGTQVAGKNYDAEYVGFEVDSFGLYFSRSVFEGNTVFRKPGLASINNPLVGGAVTDLQSYTKGGCADIRFRQLNNKAANCLFADGHAETMKYGSVRRANMWPLRSK